MANVPEKLADLKSDLDAVEYGLAYQCEDFQDLQLIVSNLTSLVGDLISCVSLNLDSITRDQSK